MLDLNDFYYFVQVVDRGGFASAARSLSIPKSTVSHRIQRLEASLGVRLINRTSRQFSMTDVGADFYRYATSIVQQAEAAENAAKQRLTEPSGLIRFTTSVATSQFAMVEMIPAFLSRFPKVKILQHATDVHVDIVADNFDIALRAHSEPLTSSALVQRTLAAAQWFLFAGANYLEREGTPETPKDLARHSSLFVTRTGVSLEWNLRHVAEGTCTVRLDPSFMSDDMVGLKHAARAGLGIVALPGYVCRKELESGELRRVLPQWSAGDFTITALVPVRHAVLPAVRAFSDFLVAEFPKIVIL